MAHRFPILKWLLALLVALPLLGVVFIAIYGWNWARGPLERTVMERTGRELVIGGDLHVRLGWPAPIIQAERVSFANPPWAREKQMFSVDSAQFSIDLLALLGRKLVFPEVRLTRPVVFLEIAKDGRRTWLLDRDQSEETARIPIGSLTLDQGRLGFDDAGQDTSIRAELSTQPGADHGVIFAAKGRYKGLPLSVQGSGGSVLALHDERVPYPLKLSAEVGRTGIRADGHITSLMKFTAMDMHLELRGASLDLLFPLFGIPFPETHPYTAAGRIVHGGTTWRYEKFSGHIGKSDIAGNFQVDNGGTRAFLSGDLNSKVLDLADLGPLIGAKEGAAKAQTAAVTGSPRLLPDIPFKKERWDKIDADVTLRAGTIRRAKELPVENLVAHLKMKDALLTLDPLDFGFAGGHLKAVITLDGRQDPIQAHARIGVRKLDLAKLFPTVSLAKASIGQLNGQFDLGGKGNSVGGMLATSEGRVGLLVANGEISKLLMEKLGLHLLEILHLTVTGDQTIKLNCAIADFGVKGGVMQSNVLVLDTEVSTIMGSGSINLARESLDLTLTPKTRNTSPVALRSPIHVRGSFSHPEVGIDKGRVLIRGAGALALGLLNPLLVLIPLVEMGPGVANQCGRLMREAEAPLPQPLRSPAPVTGPAAPAAKARGRSAS